LIKIINKNSKRKLSIKRNFFQQRSRH